MISAACGAIKISFRRPTTMGNRIAFGSAARLLSQGLRPLRSVQDSIRSPHRLSSL